MIAVVKRFQMGKREAQAESSRFAQDRHKHREHTRAGVTAPESSKPVYSTRAICFVNGILSERSEESRERRAESGERRAESGERRADFVPSPNSGRGWR